MNRDPGARAGVSTEARGPSFRARSIIVRVARLLYMHVLLVGSLVPIRNVPRAAPKCVQLGRYRGLQCGKRGNLKCALRGRGRVGLFFQSEPIFIADIRVYSFAQTSSARARARVHPRPAPARRVPTSHSCEKNTLYNLFTFEAGAAASARQAVCRAQRRTRK